MRIVQIFLCTLRIFDKKLWIFNKCKPYALAHRTYTFVSFCRLKPWSEDSKSTEMLKRFEDNDGSNDIMHKYCKNVKKTSFFCLQQHMHDLRGYFFCIFMAKARVQHESKKDSHFYVTICDNALMKMYFLLLTILNVPVYRALCAMMSLSSVQFVMLI